MKTCICLPFPPSVNRMWRTYRGRMLLSKVGREYRAEVAARCMGIMHYGSATLEVSIWAFMPDARRRDVDNLFKAPLDALCHAGIYDDDSQIVRLLIENAGIERDYPRLEIELNTYNLTTE